MATNKNTQKKDEKQSKASAQEEKKSTKASHDQEETRGKHVAADQEEAPDFDELEQLLHGDVTEVEPDAAIGAIDLWINFLKGHKEEDLKEIAANLNLLKKLLKGKKSDPAEIAEVLGELGEQANRIGDDAQRGVKGPLHQVGKALLKASQSLEKQLDEAEAEEETEEV